MTAILIQQRGCGVRYSIRDLELKVLCNVLIIRFNCC
jgi:hypothetical protein